jgi:hypothetical protein
MQPQGFSSVHESRALDLIVGHKSDHSSPIFGVNPQNKMSLTDFALIC